MVEPTLDTSQPRDALRAISYVRVSTDEQADKGYGIPTQLRANREYAERNSFVLVGAEYYDCNTGLRVIRTGGVWQFDESGRAGQLQRQNSIDPVPAFVDDCSGATPIEQRPEGRKVYQMLSGAEADALVATAIDRIVRPPEEGDEWDIAILVRGLAKVGKEIHTAQRGLIGTGFADLWTAVLEARRAGEERRKIISSTESGRISKARAGKVVGAGGALYGYDLLDGVFVINETQARIVRLIYEWYVRGDRENKPIAFREICRKLMEMGVPSPMQRNPRHNKLGSGVWRPSTVRDILTDETYAGVWHYGKTVVINGVRVPRPIEDQIAVTVTPLIDRETWQLAQVRRQSNQCRWRRNTKHDYLLRGYVKCRCGYAMIAERFGGKRHLYYRCGSHRHILRHESRVCKERTVRLDVLEPLILDRVLKALAEDPDIEKVLRLEQARELSNLKSKRNELAALQELIKEMEEEADQLAVALSKTSGGVVQQLLEKEAAMLNQRLAELNAKLRKLEAKLGGNGLTDDEIEMILHAQEKIRVGREDPKPDEVRQWFQVIQLQVSIIEHKAHISCILPSAVGVLDISNQPA